MTADSIGKALGGRKTGAGWMCRCPAHEDRTPSLSIATGKDDKVLLYCHAGCDQTQVIAVLRSRGLWNVHSRRSHAIRRSRRAIDGPQKRSEPKRSEWALRLWERSKPAAGTLAETYLESRGLFLPPAGPIRFHAGLRHPAGSIWPAMVSLVTRGTDDAPLAITRTFLARDGLGKAPVDDPKMMLGPCRGGAVRLGRIADFLLVGEGIETCLAAMLTTGHPAWAALSTSGLLALHLPREARDVVILADGDDPGEAAARMAAFRWKAEGRSVRIARPPRGCDFNDLLLGRTPHVEESRV